jgi:hypothetical protein
MGTDRAVLRLCLESDAAIAFPNDDASPRPNVNNPERLRKKDKKDAATTERSDPVNGI